MMLLYFNLRIVLKLEVVVVYTMPTRTMLYIFSPSEANVLYFILLLSEIIFLCCLFNLFQGLYTGLQNTVKLKK